VVYRKHVSHESRKNFQLDLFSPDDGHFEYSAVATNTYQAPSCQEAHVFRAPGLIGSRECSSERPRRLSVP
jgi:hypothetical protein